MKEKETTANKATAKASKNEQTAETTEEINEETTAKETVNTKDTPLPTTEKPSVTPDGAEANAEKDGKETPDIEANTSNGEAQANADAGTTANADGGMNADADTSNGDTQANADADADTSTADEENADAKTSNADEENADAKTSNGDTQANADASVENFDGEEFSDEESEKKKSKNKKKGIGFRRRWAKFCKKQEVPMRITAIVLLVIGILGMLAYFGMLIIDLSGALEKRVEGIATELVGEVGEQATLRIRVEANKVTPIAKQAAREDTPLEMARFLNEYMHDNQNVAEIRFFCGDKEYDAKGLDFDKTKESEAVLQMAEKRTSGASAYVEDQSLVSQYLAIYIDTPSLLSEMTGAVFFFEAEPFFDDMEIYTSNSLKTTMFTSLCAGDGQIIHKAHDVHFTASTDEHNNLFDALRVSVNNKEAIDAMTALVESGGGSLSVNIDNMRVSLAVNRIGGENGTIFVFAIYDPAVVFAEAYFFMRQMSPIILATVIVLLALSVWILYLKRRLRIGESVVETHDITTGVRTHRKFLHEVERIRSINRNSLFAMVYIKPAFYQFIMQCLGTEGNNEAIRFLGELFQKITSENESYGYLGEGKFVSFLHCLDDETLVNRLKVIHAIAYNYPPLVAQGRNMKLVFGIYRAERTDALSTYQMIDRAAVAYQDTNTSKDTTYRFYTKAMGEAYERASDLESKMESALKNGEFQLFLQPKLALRKRRIDGAEALVRWWNNEAGAFYNTQEYVSVFEANGSIVKLDHYIFTEVCRFMAETVAEGHAMVPLSVNVSRVTAAQDNFLPFYIETKKRFGIKDSFLTLEFTESFAYEDYEHLAQVIKALRKEGICCSIDDFGAGYSSFSILKELTIDELKMDRFFLRRGEDTSRDDTILRSVIELSKALGTKVTQEGVETQAEMERMRILGCDVIQGYYYAKPLSVVDFLIFTEKAMKQSESLS